MHHQLNPVAAQQRIADLHRAADHDRLVYAATTQPHTQPPPPRAATPSPDAAAPPPGQRWLRRHLA